MTMFRTAKTLARGVKNMNTTIDLSKDPTLTRRAKNKCDCKNDLAVPPLYTNNERVCLTCYQRDKGVSRDSTRQKVGRKEQAAESLGSKRAWVESYHAWLQRHGVNPAMMAWHS